MRRRLVIKNRLVMQRRARARGLRKSRGWNSPLPVCISSLDFADDPRDSDLINFTVFRGGNKT
jgi:hypothetical protein